MPERQLLVAKITRKVARILSTECDELDEGKDLRNFAEYDSLVIAELLAWLESEFGMEASEYFTVDHLYTTGIIADYVMEHAGWIDRKS